MIGVTPNWKNGLHDIHEPYKPTTETIRRQTVSSPHTHLHDHATLLKAAGEGGGGSQMKPPRLRSFGPYLGRLLGCTKHVALSHLNCIFSNSLADDFSYTCRLPLFVKCVCKCSSWWWLFKLSHFVLFAWKHFNRLRKFGNDSHCRQINGKLLCLGKMHRQFDYLPQMLALLI